MTSSFLSPRRRLILSAIVVALSILVMLVIAEVMVRLLSPQDMSGSWRAQSERGYMTNRAGAESRHQFGDRVVSYRFNSLGLRGGAVEPSLPKILVLGDSFTFGWLVEEQDTYVGLLQTYADREFGPGKVQLLNGGGGGWGTADYLAFLEDSGEEISPSIVVVFLNWDDIERSRTGGLYTLKDTETLELESHSRPQSRVKQTLNALPFYQWLLLHSHLLQFARTTYVRITRDDATRDRGRGRIITTGLDASETDAALGRALFRALGDWCRSHDARLLVTTPGFHFLLEGRVDGPTNVFLQTAASFFAEEGIPYRDITPEVLAATGEDLEDYIIEGDGHPNEKAYRLIARAVWPWLRPQIATILDLPTAEPR